MDTLTISKYGPVSKPVTPGKALETLEAGMTNENDCSAFDVSFMGGPNPVTVVVSPDQMRFILEFLGA